MSETFGDALGRLRRRARLSQNALAHAARIDPAYVNRMERSGARLVDGSRTQDVVPSRPIMLRICEALRLEPHERDRLLFVAGLAPIVDYQSRSERAEADLAWLRDAMRAHLIEFSELVEYGRRTIEPLESRNGAGRRELASRADR